MEKQIEELISKLNLEEKIGMIHGATLFKTAGVERLEIPPLCMSDGPMGVRAEFAPDQWINVGNGADAAGYLPCNSAIASTWNRDLAYKAGQVLGEEARGRGKDMILAPGINIKRSPLCGRNFEYMSEDPRLIEEMTVPMVKGIQSSDVAACVKHFAANSQETERLFVDTIVDERTLQEIYFPGFKAAVEKSGLLTVMGAYNKLNGEHCCTSNSLLDKILRQQWGFDGVVVSDWGGVHDTKQAVTSSLDIEMDVTSDFDNHFMARPLLEKIRKGEVSEELIDRKVRNILRMMFRLKMIGPDKAKRKSGSYNTKEHQEIILDTARESIVLLKNDENILPIDKEKAGKIAVIGVNAVRKHSDGGGSAEIKALYEITPLLGIKMLLGGNADIAYAPGYRIPVKEQENSINWQADSTKPLEQRTQAGVSGNQEDSDKIEASYLEEAVKLAEISDTVIFVGGLDHDYDVEGADRESMRLPYNQDKVLEAILEARPDTVVVMYAGSPVEMPWMSKAKSILWSYYAGMEGGTALAEVLFGKVNPSGKLAETFIKEESQCPAKTGVNFGLKDKVVYTEGVMVGYRYYDTNNTDVNFCFGHGLSYSSYKYSDLKIVQGEKTSGGYGFTEVSFDVTNESNTEGSEIVQIYVAPENKSDIARPCHELKAFDKIKLKPWEKKKVSLVLQEKDFSVYDAEKKSFIVVPGSYEIQAGASSRDIRLTGEIKIL